MNLKKIHKFSFFDYWYQNVELASNFVFFHLYFFKYVFNFLKRTLLKVTNAESIFFIIIRHMNINFALDSCFVIETKKICFQIYLPLAKDKKVPYMQDNLSFLWEFYSFFDTHIDTRMFTTISFSFCTYFPNLT